VAGPPLLQVLFEGLGLPGVPDVVWLLLRWPLVVALLVAGLALVYYFAPAHRQGWRWLTPGSAFAGAAMVLLSLGLTWFIDQDIYQIRWLTYGALGTVVVTLVWMYLMGLAVLIGGELNAVLERARRDAPERAGG
jgi:membrane protein